MHWAHLRPHEAQRDRDLQGKRPYLMRRGAQVHYLLGTQGQLESARSKRGRLTTVIITNLDLALQKECQWLCVFRESSAACNMSCMEKQDSSHRANVVPGKCCISC